MTRADYIIVMSFGVFFFFLGGGGGGGGSDGDIWRRILYGFFFGRRSEGLVDTVVFFSGYASATLTSLRRN